LSKFKTNDVMWELADFSKDLIDEIRQLLVYYKSSVYKTDTAVKVTGLMAQVEVLFLIINDEPLLEILRDYEALSECSGQWALPGECGLSMRLGHFTREASPALEEYQRRIQRVRSPLKDEQIKIMTERRRSLLSVCRKGSRSWELLKSL
jgi:hypothetical protein